ncbi:MAG: hypothetical protein O7D29_01900 [Gemmatimonadetes bacterium]|nr:hypothetical protein [Deltaproteobacteria bacterium]MCZ6759113.1 hypothetical protein [Gemmatimonadota bacterium]
MGKRHHTIFTDLKLPPAWRGDRLPWDLGLHMLSELNKLRSFEQRWPSKEIKRAMNIGVL